MRRLLPGHCLTVSAGGSGLRRYWSVDLNRELRLPSDDEYAQAFREIFTEAVRCRLRSAYPIASMLSGGLDSSSVTCMARQVLGGQPLPTFSIIFNQAHEADERTYMHEVVASDDLAHHEVIGDGLSPLNDVDRVLWYMEEPFRNLGVYFQWLTYQAVQQQGLRLLLSGNGGDAMVSYGPLPPGRIDSDSALGMACGANCKTLRWLEIGIGAGRGAFGSSMAAGR